MRKRIPVGRLINLLSICSLFVVAVPALYGSAAPSRDQIIKALNDRNHDYAALLRASLDDQREIQARYARLIESRPGFGATTNATISAAVLPFAGAQHWTTDIDAIALPGGGGTLSVANCSNGPTFDLTPGQTALVTGAQGYLCGDFGTLPSPDGLDVHALLKFDDGLTRASYYVPPIGSADVGTVQSLGPIRSDAEMQTCFIGFPATGQSLSASFFDAQNNPAGTESFTVNAPVGIHCFTTAPPSGRVEITVDGGWGSGTDGPGPVPCFLAVGSVAGGNAAILPCR